MKKVIIKKEMFYSLLIPYVLLGIVGLISFRYMYTTSIKNVNNEVIRGNYSILNKIVREIDYLVSDIERLVIEVDSNPRFARILNLDKNRTGSDNYKLAMGINELKKIKKYNYLIEDLILYYHKGDFFINALGIRDADLLYTDYLLGENKNQEEWNQKLKENYPIGKLIKILDEIFYIVTIPTNETVEYSNVIVKVNTEQFNALIGSYDNLNEGKFYILDRDFELLASNDADGSSSFEKDIENLRAVTSTLSNQEIGSITLNSQKYRVFYIEENSSDLHYIWMIEEYQLRAKSSFILVAFTGMGVAFVLLLILGIKGVKKNYKKIEHIINRLSKSNLSIEDHKYSEVTYINSILNNIEKKLKSQEKIMIESILRKALYGLIEETDENYAYILKNQKTLCTQGSVITLFEDMDIERKKAKDLKLSIFMIENIIKEIFNGNIMSWVIPLNDWYVIILNGQEEDENELDYILEGVERTRKFLAEQLKIEYTIGVSSPIIGISNFGAGYKEALEALEEKQIIGTKQMIYYGNIEENHNQYEFDQTKHKQWINSLKLGDSEKAHKMIEEIYQINFKEKQISAECGRLLLLDCLETIKQVAKELNISLEIDTKDVFKKSYTVYDIRDKIDDLIEEICKITDQVKENAKEREERIIQYIKEHYKDMNLNVATVADQFELNASYLSRLFKEQTGENLLSYINKYRVEQAKKLLQGTTKTLIKVAEETGFLNTAALTRAFKKYEGVTPGQYKEIYGNKK